MSKTNEISKQVGLSRRTLQYYDDEGLLPVKRDSNNYRVYDQNTLQRIWEILIHKEMGLKLQEIRRLLTLSPPERIAALSHHLEELKNTIRILKIQEAFVVQIMQHGMPETPDSNGKTYLDSIEEMREKIAETVSRQ